MGRLDAQEVTPRDNLLKKLRGKDYRLAFRAIGDLRRLQDPSILSTVVDYPAKDAPLSCFANVSRYPIRAVSTTVHVVCCEFLDSWADDDGIIDVLVTALNETHDEICNESNLGRFLPVVERHELRRVLC